MNDPTPQGRRSGCFDRLLVHGPSLGRCAEFLVAVIGSLCARCWCESTLKPPRWVLDEKPCHRVGAGTLDSRQEGNQKPRTRARCAHIVRSENTKAVFARLRHAKP